MTLMGVSVASWDTLDNRPPTAPNGLDAASATC